MEYWSVGVLRILRIAPAERVGGAFRAHIVPCVNPGLKPWAMIFCRFAASAIPPLGPFFLPDLDRLKPRRRIGDLILCADELDLSRIFLCG